MYVIKILSFITLSPIILLTRILRPIILIRFGHLRSERIGHFAGNTEMYLCARETGLIDQRSIDIFGFGPKVANYQLLKMWRRKLIAFSFIRAFFWVNKKIPFHEAHTVQMPSDRDTHGLLTTSDPSLQFTSEEERMGKEYLKKQGVQKDDKFICFYARDPGYLNTFFPERDWAYHNYRDSSITSQLKAVETLAEQFHYTSFRMGSAVDQPLDSDDNLIVDYAKSKDRSDFLDIYLSAKCHLFLTAEGGLAVVPYVFRRPTVAVNQIPLRLCPISPKDIFLPKKLWLTKESRFLTFREIIESDAGTYTQADQYINAGIKIVDNTPDEIADAALEMDMRLKGIWRATDEDEHLQKMFSELLLDSGHKEGFHNKTVARVGCKFLKDNQHLLN